MPPKKPRYTGVLLKSIYLDDSKPRGLRAALGAPADESDKLAHIEDALRVRYAALDKFFGLEELRSLRGTILARQLNFIN